MFGNNFGNSFGGYGNSFTSPYQQQMQMQGYQQQQAMQQQMPLRTNKIFVTSIEEAMSKYADPNTEIVYYHQDKPMLIEVKTDIQGRKTCNVFDLSAHQEDKAIPVVAAGITREEIEKIVQEEIEKAIERKKKNKKETTEGSVGESKISGRIE